MPFQPEPQLANLPEKTAVLLVNLGTPEAPTAAALRPYLAEFLGDPRVVEIPRLAWLPILHGVILNTRPSQSAQKYASIWTPEGSPLKVHTERQTALLRDRLRVSAPDVLVEYAMRYGHPSSPDVLAKLKAQNCQRIVLLPLYPQYAASTVATTCDAVFAVLKTMRNAPALRTVREFHNHPGYIRAVAQNAHDYWSQHGRPDVLVMSFHGLPKFTVNKGDPYYHQCLESGRLIAQALELDESQYRITFQSRFGRAEWLQPYTAATLHELG
ncbi:MAG: ferrochelatase, partial [Gallionellaceae bacterium]|nr:ferrochelatase [Gallionellaceae bacterium]